MIKFCAKKKLTAIANQLYVEVKGKVNFSTPSSKLGGKRVQDEELVENPFARAFVFENRNTFDPENEQDRIEIV